MTIAAPAAEIIGVVIERTPDTTYGEELVWSPEVPRFKPLILALDWIVSAAAVGVAAAIVPHVAVKGVGEAFIAAAVIAILNAVLSPVIAALRLPFTLALSFVLVLVLDAVVLLLASKIDPNSIRVDSFGWALAAALVISAASMVLQVLLGVNDEDTYMLRVIRRVARRQGGQVHSSEPGIVFLEIDGLALPVLARAMRDGVVPEMARWRADGTHLLAEWETDLSSQTGASQAGILLGSNENIPAFRWVEKESGKVMSCSSPEDCAEIERRVSTGDGLLTNDGASRGNLFSGEADAVILTVSKMEAEKRANPGYRAFFANGFNVTRVLVLFGWEVILERIAAIRQIRRDVSPRGERTRKYALLRAALCVGVRDLIVFGVLTDMMRGRPAVYATFSSYDEVAHHSGLERADTMEALRKLDQHFARINRARRYAPRPYKLVVLSDHGQTQGATFKQRNGYDLGQLVERSVERGTMARIAQGDENDAAVGHAVNEATGTNAAHEESADKLTDRHVVALASGNLGLIYLMEEKRRLTLEEIEQRHPRLIPALRDHPHIGFLLVRSDRHGPVVLGSKGMHYLDEGRVEGEDPLAPFPPNAGAHLRRTDGFDHVADIMVNSFYDHELQQGCAFEELISFHGGMGGPQTQPFLLYPAELPLPAEPIVGAAQVHAVLSGWRRLLQAQTPRPDASLTAPVPE
ncbi:MAG TPA: phage holin family protein [Solirubrobacteraceae bacterium]|nr:phage holin family protein [Solirubrobacteraceae bacterium]